MARTCRTPGPARWPRLATLLVAAACFLALGADLAASPAATSTSGTAAAPAAPDAGPAPALASAAGPRVAPDATTGRTQGEDPQDCPDGPGPSAPASTWHRAEPALASGENPDSGRAAILRVAPKRSPPDRVR